MSTDNHQVVTVQNCQSASPPESTDKFILLAVTPSLVKMSLLLKKICLGEAFTRKEINIHIFFQLPNINKANNLFILVNPSLIETHP